MTRGISVDERKRLAEEARDAHDTLPTEPLCVRISAAVKLTGIGRSTLYELINAGEIETVKVGRSTFILFRSLKKLILG